MAAHEAVALAATDAATSEFAAVDWSTAWFAQFAARGERWQRAALTS
jgi:hypothetical protein